ncbi:hypothetical protein DN757_02385 [Paenibacillus silvae]|uniref:Uncharacterized protein n=1 Tax=Paenibacillus silvae TaxID=1325358 RepID=A0A2W6NNV9_9BACL|nr:hypothetical protein DN757_02385 [Paenibacillus silvae]
MANYSIIQDSANYKTFKNNTWITLSSTLPIKDVFLSEGITNLNVLDRKSTLLLQNMTDTGSLGSGKVYKSTVDLKKYIEIANLSVK